MPGSGGPPPAGRLSRRLRRPRLLPAVAAFLALVGLLLSGGCAKYNTYYNASKAFNEAEQIREDRLKEGQQTGPPSGTQLQKYQQAVDKCQKILDEYPGSGLTDDALFMMAKAYHRMESYRRSVRNLELLFANFPKTPFLEEAIYLQAMNYLFIGDMTGSNEQLERLAKTFPHSRFQADALRVRGENSFTLEQWDKARQSFQQYVTQYPESEDHEEVSLKLGRCLYELKEYAAAADRLGELIRTADSKELAFRAGLLLARSLIRQGDYDEVERQVHQLRETAEIYNARGDVTLIEAENLYRQGKLGEAAPLLEGMPEDWRTDEVRVRSEDLLGWIAYERWELEKARDHFQNAVRRQDLLDDPEASAGLLVVLREYLAASEQVTDAAADRVPELELLQANALLFGMQRPRLALVHYKAALASEAVDSLVAPRALYGEMLIYRDRLSEPDSARIMEERLRDEYPESPQAYHAEHRGDTDSDLLGYLLERRDRAREEARLAALASADSAAALADSALTAATDTLQTASAPGEAAADTLSSDAVPEPMVPEPMTTEPMTTEPRATDLRATDLRATGSMTTEPIMPEPIAPDTATAGADSASGASAAAGGEGGR
jgi:TolA-binding protein